MQDMNKAAKDQHIHDIASEFLDTDELDNISNYVSSLETLYLSRCLGSVVPSEQEKSGEKMIRIALALESELFLKLSVNTEPNNGKMTENFSDAFYLIANVMEYAARIHQDDDDDKARLEYWLRASIAYNYSGYIANSIFSARQCHHFLTASRDDEFSSLYDDMLQLIIYFLSRDFKRFKSLSNMLSASLESRVQKTDDVKTTEEYYLRLGFSGLATTLGMISEYLIDGVLNDNSDHWWKMNNRNIVFVQMGGDSFFSWIISRLHYVFQNSISHSLWSSKAMIPGEVIAALTKNEEDPIYELWTSQQKALQELTAQSELSRIIISMPTSAGKTLVSAILIARELIKNRDRNALYITPLRALVDEISEFFAKYFHTIGLDVAYLPGDYDSMPQLEALVGRNARIIVLTPEKLDLLWRVNDIRLQGAGIFVFDEVQLLREKGRGARLELLICKMSEIYGKSVKLVLVSAVIPPSNLVQFINWLGSNSTKEFESQWSPTRLREAYFYRADAGSREGHADLMYFKEKAKKNPLLIRDVLPPGKVAKHVDAAQLAWKYQSNFGPVLIYANQKLETEKIARMIYNLAREQSTSIPKNSRLLSAAHHVRELLGSNFQLPEMLEYGIAYHHASLPEDVKYVIQNLAKNKDLKVIVCTTTLAEGVNLNIKSVIIGDPVAGSEKMDGLRLRNLAGRAGRALRDTEGHVIVMHPDSTDLLLDINLSRIRSRFFNYIESLAEESGLDTDANAIEANLLARAYKKELTRKEIVQKTMKIANSTLFAKQANVSDFRRMYSKVYATAANVVDEAQKEDQNVLKVFAETGLDLAHCRVLNKVAKELASGQDLRLRSAYGQVNWNILEIALNGCLSASEEGYTTDMKKVVKEPLAVLKQWLEGLSVLEITKSIDPSVDSETFSRVSYFLFGYTVNDLAWAAAAFVKLLFLHVPSLFTNSREWELVPNYLRFGTVNTSSLLLMVSHAMDRETAIAITKEKRLVPNSSLDWLRLIGWLSFATSNIQASFEKVKTNLISRLDSFSVQLKLPKEKYSTLLLSPDGNIIDENRIVGKLDGDIVHLINAIKSFSKCKTSFSRNENDEWELSVTIDKFNI
jgi:replicative superfamily II helicase